MQLLTADYMQDLAFIVSVVALLTESVVEMAAKPLIKQYVKDKEKSDLLLHSASLLVSFIFTALLLAQPSGQFDYISFLICGFLASRGSNYAHNWFDNMPKSKKQELPPKVETK